MKYVVLGVFSQRDQAEKAIEELESEGYNPKDMSIMMKDTTQARELFQNTGARDVVGGTLGGATTGAVLGGIAGLVASFVIPGLGAFFIGGPLATALGLSGAAATTASGAATGALAGGLIGALTSAFGLSEEEARTYENRISEGGILVAVPVEQENEMEVENTMNDFGADNVRSVRSDSRMEKREEMPTREYRGAYNRSDYSLPKEVHYNEMRKSDIKKQQRKSKK